MRPQRLIVSILAFLITISGAAALELSHKIVQDEIGWDGTAVFNLYVKNDGGIGESYRLRPSTFLWGDVVIDPPVVTVFSGETQPAVVKITPPKGILRGTYDIEIIGISNQDPTEQSKDILRVYINTEEPHLAADFGMPDAMAPASDKFNIILKNTGTAALTGLTANLQSNLLPYSDIKLNYLDAGQASLVFDRLYEIPSNTAPGKYDVSLELFKDGIHVGDLNKIVEILGQVKVSAYESIAKGFLSETHIVTLENVGNIPAVNSYLVDVPKWQRIFVHSTPKAYVTKLEGAAQFAWPYSLQTSESTQIIYKISYVPLLAALIAALVLMFSAGWYYRQEFTVLKEVFDEPGSKAMKVRLTIKSRAPLVQNSVIVEDAVPTPLKLVKEFATAEPTAIRRQAGAMKVVWKFDKVYPGEERVLSYNLKSTLPMFGNLVLPAAKVRVRMNNKPKLYLSNRVTFSGRGVKVDEPVQIE
ncbi:MAG: hypothetical protein V1839_00685 [archaeon]